MNRCAACGGFFDADECPHDHSHVETWYPPAELPARLCGACGHYFRGESCPNDHKGILVDKSLLTVGSAVTCDVTGLWSGTDTLPGIVVSAEGDSYRVLVALPGDQGSVSAVTLPSEKVSW